MKVLRWLKQLLCKHEQYPYRALNATEGLVCKKCLKSYRKKARGMMTEEYLDRLRKRVETRHEALNQGRKSLINALRKDNKDHKHDQEITSLEINIEDP